VPAPVYQRAIRRRASGTLLDLGCGKVPLFWVYKNLVADAICVDWETRGDISHLDHSVNLNEKIPLCDKQFDTVLATDVLEHVASPEHVFREVAGAMTEIGTTRGRGDLRQGRVPTCASGKRRACFHWRIDNHNGARSGEATEDLVARIPDAAPVDVGESNDATTRQPEISWVGEGRDGDWPGRFIPSCGLRVQSDPDDRGKT